MYLVYVLNICTYIWVLNICTIHMSTTEYTETSNNCKLI